MGYPDDLMERTKELACAYIKETGYDMVDFSFFKAKGSLTLRFLVDRPEGGISLEECARLNEGLGGILDRENILEQSYVLEVSSPGLDRMLSQEKDFLRASGKEVRVILNEPLESKIEFQGRVESVKDGILSLDTENKIVKIQLNKIKKAKQVIK